MCKSVDLASFRASAGDLCLPSC